MEPIKGVECGADVTKGDWDAEEGMISPPCTPFSGTHSVFYILKDCFPGRQLLH
jgi:hypothetical protein